MCKPCRTTSALIGKSYIAAGKAGMALHTMAILQAYQADAFPPIKLIPAVLCRVKVSSARLLLIAPFWPSQIWFSELTPLLYRSPWKIPIRRDLLSQLQSRIWHPQPELWKLWVWPIQGQGLWWMFYLSRFRRPSPVPELPLLGSCTLPSGASLSPGV